MSKRMRFCLRDHRAADCPCINEGHLMTDDYDWNELLEAAKAFEAGKIRNESDIADAIDRLRKAIEPKEPTDE